MIEADSHLPTPEFRARLERKLARTLRQDCFISSGARRSPRERLKIAALLVAALGMGAIGGVASAQVQDARQRDQLLAAARAEIQLAELRLGLARSQAETVEERHRLGLIGREVLASADAEVQRMQSDLARIQLDLEEIQASAAPPRDDIAAPTLRGRDFVKERMLLRLSTVQNALTAAETALAEAESRNRVGLASDLVVLEARTVVTQHRAELELLSERADLRRQFLKDGVDVRTITRREQRLELTQAIRVAEERLHLAQTRLDHVRERHRLGQADQIELLRAELAASETALELQRMRQQLAELDGSVRE
jgi:hypothetical protein